jgi:hypothetical protein
LLSRDESCHCTAFRIALSRFPLLAGCDQIAENKRHAPTIDILADLNSDQRKRKGLCGRHSPVGILWEALEPMRTATGHHGR